MKLLNLNQDVLQQIVRYLSLKEATALAATSHCADLVTTPRRVRSVRLRDPNALEHFSAFIQSKPYRATHIRRLTLFGDAFDAGTPLPKVLHLASRLHTLICYDLEMALRACPAMHSPLAALPALHDLDISSSSYEPYGLRTCAILGALGRPGGITFLALDAADLRGDWWAMLALLQSTLQTLRLDVRKTELMRQDVLDLMPRGLVCPALHTLELNPTLASLLPLFACVFPNLRTFTWLRDDRVRLRSIAADAATVPWNLDLLTCSEFPPPLLLCKARKVRITGSLSEPHVQLLKRVQPTVVSCGADIIALSRLRGITSLQYLDVRVHHSGDIEHGLPESTEVIEQLPLVGLHVSFRCWTSHSATELNGILEKQIEDMAERMPTLQSVGVLMDRLSFMSMVAAEGRIWFVAGGRGRGEAKMHRLPAEQSAEVDGQFMAKF